MATFIHLHRGRKTKKLSVSAIHIVTSPIQSLLKHIGAVNSALNVILIFRCVFPDLHPETTKNVTQVKLNTCYVKVNYWFNLTFLSTESYNDSKNVTVWKKSSHQVFLHNYTFIFFSHPLIWGWLLHDRSKFNDSVLISKINMPLCKRSGWLREFPSNSCAAPASPVSCLHRICFFVFSFYIISFMQQIKMCPYLSHFTTRVTSNGTWIFSQACWDCKIIGKAMFVKPYCCWRFPHLNCLKLNKGQYSLFSC